MLNEIRCRSWSLCLFLGSVSKIVRWPFKSVGGNSKRLSDGLGRPSYMGRQCVLKQSVALLLVAQAVVSAQEAVPVAQDLIPAGEEQPFLRLEPGGPQSYVTALAFDATGSTLYAAGWDKVVHVWRRDPQAAGSGSKQHCAFSWLRLSRRFGLRPPECCYRRYS